MPAEHRLSQTLAEVWAVPEVENLPAAQALQTLAEVWADPEVEYLPAPQFVHSKIEVRPSTVENVPGGQVPSQAALEFWAGSEE